MECIQIRTPQSEIRNRLAVFLILISAARLLFVLYAPCDLSGDEAQYWDWSRHPDWCYFSKGPVVAWCIWVGRLVFGETVLAVRSGAILMSAVSSVLLFLLGRRLYNERVGAWAAVLVQVTPLFAAYGIGMTIDPPFLLFWILALLLFHRAVAGNRWLDWVGFGAAVGLGMLSKYTMAFFYPCALGYLFFSTQYRRRLIELRPWVGILISLAFLTPVLIWNVQHGWVNFQHNAGHTRWQDGLVVRPIYLLEFIGGQLAVITPVLAVMMVYALIRNRKDDRFSFWFSIPILAFFLVKSVQGEVYPNWPMVAYVAGFFAFADRFILSYPQDNIHVRRLTRAAVIIPAVATAVIMAGAFLGYFANRIEDRLDRWEWNPAASFRKITGWQAVGREAARLRDENGGPDKCFILCDERLVTSRMAFYTPGHPRTYQVRFDDEIASQYHIWPGYEHLLHHDAICIVQDNGKGKKDAEGNLLPTRLHPKIRSQFARVDPPIYPAARDSHGAPIRSCAIYVCRDFLGLPPADQK